MAERGTGPFARLHPTTRKYVSGEIEREPLPKELRELVERLREAEPFKDTRGHAGKKRRKRKSPPIG